MVVFNSLDAYTVLTVIFYPYHVFKHRENDGEIVKDVYNVRVYDHDTSNRINAGWIN